MKAFGTFALVCVLAVLAVHARPESELPHSRTRLPFKPIDAEGLQSAISQALQGVDFRATLEEDAIITSEADSNSAWDYAVRRLSRPQSGDNDTCSACVRNASHCVLKVAIHHVKKMCNTTTCPYLKQRCEYMKNHKKIALGMIMAHVRPLSLAHAYCLGAEDCQFPNHTHWREVQIESLGDLLPTYAARAFFAQAMDGVQGTPDKDDYFMRSIRLIASDNGQLLPRDSDCNACITFMSHEVMHWTLMYIAKRCEGATEHHTRKMCEWMDKNPELSYGVLLVHVRPDEWSCGFCFGKGLCHHHKNESDPHSTLFRKAPIDRS